MGNERKVTKVPETDLKSAVLANAENTCISERGLIDTSNSFPTFSLCLVIAVHS